MSFENKYPVLYQFFVGYFPEADLDGLSDQEVVVQFIEQNPTEIVKDTQKALNELPDDVTLLKEISRDANRYFETPEAFRNWIEMIKTELSRGGTND